MNTSLFNPNWSKTLLNKINADLSFTQDCIDPFDEHNENLWVKLEHLGRYLFAADYLRRFKPNSVADIACGLGYGLPELEKIADQVVGVDGNAEILERASEQCSPQTQLLQHDLEGSDLSSHWHKPQFDAIVSFETLEHLVDPALAVQQFSQLLREDGFLICSVPNVLFEPRDEAGVPTNPYHKQLFNYRLLSQLLTSSGFHIHYRLGQALSNLLFKRESQLLRHRILQQRIGDYDNLHSPDVIRHLSYLLAYPTVEDAEGSYAMIVVARKVGQK
jgi:SAM-dependent methyltransferase